MAVSLCLGTVADVFAECCFKYEVKKKKEKKAAILSPVPKTLVKLTRRLLAIYEAVWQDQTILQRVLIPPKGAEDAEE